ncbi:MAG: polysulfide reductase NrfD, partial [Chloroflexia bacterium]|nr:polysulfide reductase NrfD [Chloroflexia bacterium]
MSRKERDGASPSAPRAPAPPIHRSHWGWLIVAYFFLGGIAGGAQVIASLSGLVGGKRSAGVTRLARYVSFAAFLPCPPLLVFDLGRPARFLQMLRVVKLRSPMSVGSWTLVAFGGAATLAALDQAGADGLLPPALSRLRHRWWSSAANAAGLPLGLGLAGYTGVLLAVTAVPLWTRRALVLGPLFLASALSTAAAAVDLLSLATREARSGSGALHRVERIAALAESLLLVAWLGRLGRAGRPLAAGSLAPWVHHGVAGLGLALPSVLGAAAPHLPRKAGRAARALATVA